MGENQSFKAWFWCVNGEFKMRERVSGREWEDEEDEILPQ